MKTRQIFIIVIICVLLGWLFPVEGQIIDFNDEYVLTFVEKGGIYS